MSRTPDILLLREPSPPGAAAPSPPETVRVQEEPFAALEELTRRRYRAVVVAGPRPDWRELLGAIRRLQPEARLFALTTPSGESELLRAGTTELEDYFILPATRGEWRRILQTATPVEPGNLEPPPGQTNLPARQVMELLQAAGDPDRLAECVARLVEQVCGVSTRWSLHDQGRGGAQRLLTLDDEPSRILWADEPLSGPVHRFEWLSALRGLLPSLAENARRMRTLHRLATTDDLTGAYNRRYFMHFARQLLERARCQRFRVTLLVYDIDDFKIYNDRFGHAAGDEILRQTARMMKQITRRHDVVARIGGDEFAVLFWDAGQPRQPNSRPPRDAYALADRFRQAVNSARFKSLGPHASGTLTISGGLASFPWDALDVPGLLEQADQALLKAKESGKNCIYLVGGQNGQPPAKP